MSEKAKYKLKVDTAASRINQEGEFHSPEQYGVLCCVLAGQLSDDHKLLKAAPELLEASRMLIDSVEGGSTTPEEAINAARAAIAKATGEA